MQDSIFKVNFKAFKVNLKEWYGVRKNIYKGKTNYFP